MKPRRMNADGEWVDADDSSLAKSATRGPDGTHEEPPSRSGKLTRLGWLFLLLAVGALLAGAIAATGLGLGRRSDQRTFGVLFGGGLLALVTLTAALFRVFGARFFHE